MTKFAEGSTFVSKLHKERKCEERLVGGEYDGTGRYASQEIPVDTFSFSVSGQRTVCTARFAFARVGVQIHVNVRPDQREDAFEYVRGVVTEILEREEAGLRKREREDFDIDEAPFDLFGRVVSIDYGLTIPLPNYESRKIDIGMTEPIDDGELLGDGIERVQAWILERLDEEQKRMSQDGGSDVGI